MSRSARSVTGALSESAFQAQVVGLARFYDWTVYHPPANRPSASGRRQTVTPGYPDLTLIRIDDVLGIAELIFAELKTNTGRLGPGQPEWAAMLTALSDAVRATDKPLPALPGSAHTPVVDYYLWRPADWLELEERLSRGRRRIPIPPPQ